MNCQEFEYISFSFFSKDLRIVIIGGGNAALIKVKSLVKCNCNIKVVSKEFIEDFNKYDDVIDRVTKEYTKEDIEECHIVIIALDEKLVVEKIIEDCKNKNKIYINCKNFKEGMGVIPIQVEGRNIKASINTKGGNPKAALFLGNKIDEIIKDDDYYIGFITEIRNYMKEKGDINKEIMNYVISEDFRKIFNTGKAIRILQLFYPLVFKDLK